MSTFFFSPRARERAIASVTGEMMGRRDVTPRVCAVIYVALSPFCHPAAAAAER